MNRMIQSRCIREIDLMYTADPKAPAAWEVREPRGHRILQSIKNWLYRAFLRDVVIIRIQVAKLIVRAVILATFFVFWIVTLFSSTPSGFKFPEVFQWAISLIGGLVILFGGIITDTLIERHGVFEQFSLLEAVPMIVILFTDNLPLLYIAMGAFIIILGFLVLLFFTGLLINTNMLNRTRVIVLMLVFMASVAIPVILLLVMTQAIFWIWIIVIVLAIGSLAISKKYPRRFTPMINKVYRTPSLKAFFYILTRSHALRHASFLFCIAISLGFQGITAWKAISDWSESLALGIGAIASLPIIAAVFDNFGRKPLVYLMLVLVGIFAIFSGQSVMQELPLRVFRAIVYGFAMMLLLILAIVLAGDLSSSFSRGRITGILTFMLVVGAIIGILTGNRFSNMNPVDVITTSDWITFSTFLAALLFATTRELLQPGTTSWRDSLVRLHVFMENGLSLVFKEFKKQGRVGEGSMEDLESGGLSGLQQLMMEIASTKQKIRVLDHGDTILIFHHAAFTTAVLFVKKNLVIYREKLADFHLQFEDINKDAIHGNYVNQDALQHVDWLIQTYFT